MQNDTIAAISTPLGQGALGIIRLSGPRSLQSLKKIFNPNSSLDITKAHTHTTHYGHIINSNNGNYTDEVMVTIMRAPRSYTREDIVEISCHGNPVILNGILNTILNNGVRLAEPGEFTKRAFLNGRIDLSQAEAVMDLINAKTKESSESAIKHLSGIMSSKIRGMHDILVESLTLIEAEIDFPEENITKTTNNQLIKNLQNLLTQLNQLIKSYQHGKILKNGIKTVIIGKANVGKSSLFNILSDTPSRALVTHIPGTTRDSIEEDINLGGILFHIADTAGIKSPRGRIEEEIIKLTHKHIKDADFILFILDGSRRISSKDLEIGKLAQKKPFIIVINKKDLSQKISKNRIKILYPKTSSINISCKLKTGIDYLKEHIIELSQKILKNSKYASEFLVTNTRHKKILENARQSIQDALKATKNELSAEFIASDLYHSLEYLQQITGETASEDILNEIFSKFCIGK